MSSSSDNNETTEKPESGSEPGPEEGEGKGVKDMSFPVFHKKLNGHLKEKQEEKNKSFKKNLQNTVSLIKEKSEKEKEVRRECLQIISTKRVFALVGLFMLPFTLIFELVTKIYKTMEYLIVLVLTLISPRISNVFLQNSNE